MGPRSRTAMRGFKEDFDAWRDTLTPEEKALVSEQAAGEFDKKFRKTDKFTQDLPGEKVEGLAKALGKFFENEAEDYKKEEDRKRTPDYDVIKKKASGKEFDWSLKMRVEEIDREADRRYAIAMQMTDAARAKGEGLPPAAPYEVSQYLPNKDEESHKRVERVYEYLKMASEKLSPVNKKKVEEFLAKGVPPMGEDVTIVFPKALKTIQDKLVLAMEKSVTDLEKEDPEKLGEFKAGLDDTIVKLMVDWTNKHEETKIEVQRRADKVKELYALNAEALKDFKGTKADLAKDVWEAWPKVLGKEIAPLDEEFLAELAKKPAFEEGEANHPWATAEKLYKSVAIDPFGLKFLLGIYETPEEAKKAFAEWNEEYVKADAAMKDDVDEWSKRQQAKAELNVAAVDRIKKILEEARR